MKIVFICSEYPPAPSGGIGVVLRGLCEGLAKAGLDVHVVGCYPVKQVIDELSNGVKIHRIPGRLGRLGLLTDRMAMKWAISRIRQEGPIDIIEAPDFEGPSAFLPRASERRVIRLHGSHTYFARERGEKPSRSIRLLEYVALAQADCWISCSNYTAVKTHELFGLKRSTDIVHNAAFVPAKYPRKSDYSEVKRAVYFGTLAEKKGVLALAEAWRSFSQQHTGWTLTAFGRDAQHQGRSVKEKMLELLGPQWASVEFAGPVSHDILLKWLPGFDFAVLPSYSEAFAIAPMEAMALGLPLIFTSLSSGPELIEHNKDGWLANPHDVPSLTQLLGNVARDPSLRQRLAIAGREKIQNHLSYDAFVRKNIALYERVLKIEEYR